MRKDGRRRRGGGNVVWLGRGTVVTSLSSLALARSVSLGGSRPGHCRAAQLLSYSVCNPTVARPSLRFRGLEGQPAPPELLPCTCRSLGPSGRSLASALNPLSMLLHVMDGGLLLACSYAPSTASSTAPPHDTKYYLPCSIHPGKRWALLEQHDSTPSRERKVDAVPRRGCVRIFIDGCS